MALLRQHIASRVLYPFINLDCVCRNYLRHEYVSKMDGKHLAFTNDKMGAKEAEVPYQDNSCDCGLFLLHYVEKIFKVRCFEILKKEIIEFEQ